MVFLDYFSRVLPPNGLIEILSVCHIEKVGFVIKWLILIRLQTRGKKSQEEICDASQD